jgi:hypothetical protein
MNGPGFMWGRMVFCGRVAAGPFWELPRVSPETARKLSVLRQTLARLTRNRERERAARAGNAHSLPPDHGGRRRDPARAGRFQLVVSPVRAACLRARFWVAADPEFQTPMDPGPPDPEGAPPNWRLPTRRHVPGLRADSSFAQGEVCSPGPNEIRSAGYKPAPQNIVAGYEDFEQLSPYESGLTWTHHAAAGGGDDFAFGKNRLAA